MRFEKKLDDPVRHIMTRKDKLVTVREGASDEEVLDLLHRHRIEKVLVVNDAFELRGLLGQRHVLVQDAQAAKLRHGDGEAGFAHGVHGRRQDRQADGEVTGDAGGERDVLRKDGRMRGDERYVVESQRFSLDAQHGRARGG